MWRKASKAATSKWDPHRKVYKKGIDPKEKGKEKVSPRIAMAETPSRALPSYSQKKN